MYLKRFVSLLILLLSVALRAAGAGGDDPKKDNNCGEKKAVTTLFSFDEAKNIIKMSFTEQEITTNEPEQVRYFRDERCYPIEEDFELPPDLCRQLGALRPLVIKAGLYPVLFEKGVYTIVIPL